MAGGKNRKLLLHDVHHVALRHVTVYDWLASADRSGVLAGDWLAGKIGNCCSMMSATWRAIAKELVAAGDGAFLD